MVAGIFRGTEAEVDEDRFRFFEPVAKKGSGIPLQLTGSSEVGEICSLVEPIVNRPGTGDDAFPHFQRSFHVYVIDNPCVFRALTWSHHMEATTLLPRSYYERKCRMFL